MHGMCTVKYTKILETSLVFGNFCFDDYIAVIGDKCLNNLMYTDDICCFAPSFKGL